MTMLNALLILSILRRLPRKTIKMLKISKASNNPIREAITYSLKRSAYVEVSE